MTLSKAGFNRIVRFSVYSLELLVFYVVQQVPNFFPYILGSRPYLVLAFALTVAILESEGVALAFGVLSGFFMDMCLETPMGSMSLILAVVCCVVSVVANGKINITIINAWFIGIVSLAVLIASIWFISFVMPGYSFPWIALVDKYLAVYIYTALILPIIYILNLGIFLALRK